MQNFYYLCFRQNNNHNKKIIRKLPPNKQYLLQHKTQNEIVKKDDIILMLKTYFVFTNIHTFKIFLKSIFYKLIEEKEYLNNIFQLNPNIQISIDEKGKNENNLLKMKRFRKLSNNDSTSKNYKKSYSALEIGYYTIPQSKINENELNEKKTINHNMVDILKQIYSKFIHNKLPINSKNNSIVKTSGSTDIQTWTFQYEKLNKKPLIGFNILFSKHFSTNAYSFQANQNVSNISNVNNSNQSIIWYNPNSLSQLSFLQPSNSTFNIKKLIFKSIFCDAKVNNNNENIIPFSSLFKTIEYTRKKRKKIENIKDVPLKADYFAGEGNNQIKRLIKKAKEMNITYYKPKKIEPPPVDPKILKLEKQIEEAKSLSQTTDTLKELIRKSVEKIKSKSLDNNNIREHLRKTVLTSLQPVQKSFLSKFNKMKETGAITTTTAPFSTETKKNSNKQTKINNYSTSKNYGSDSNIKEELTKKSVKAVGEQKKLLMQKYSSLSKTNEELTNQNNVKSIEEQRKLSTKKYSSISNINEELKNKKNVKSIEEQRKMSTKKYSSISNVNEELTNQKIIKSIMQNNVETKNKKVPIKNKLCYLGPLKEKNVEIKGTDSKLLSTSTITNKIDEITNKLQTKTGAQIKKISSLVEGSEEKIGSKIIKTNSSKKQKKHKSTSTISINKKTLSSKFQNYSKKMSTSCPSFSEILTPIKNPKTKKKFTTKSDFIAYMSSDQRRNMSSDERRNKKKDYWKNKKEIKICDGCAAVAKADEEARNPPPKKKLDCTTRISYPCPGPKRKLPLGSKPVLNPYQRCQVKPKCLCNQPRPNSETRKKLPCCMDYEDEKRNYHTLSPALALKLDNSGTASNNNNNNETSNIKNEHYYFALAPPLFDPLIESKKNIFEPITQKIYLSKQLNNNKEKGSKKEANTKIEKKFGCGRPPAYGRCGLVKPDIQGKPTGFFCNIAKIFNIGCGKTKKGCKGKCDL